MADLVRTCEERMNEIRTFSHEPSITRTVMTFTKAIFLKGLYLFAMASFLSLIHI